MAGRRKASKATRAKATGRRSPAKRAVKKTGPKTRKTAKKPKRAAKRTAVRKTARKSATKASKPPSPARKRKSRVAAAKPRAPKAAARPPRQKATAPSQPVVAARPPAPRPSERRATRRDAKPRGPGVRSAPPRRATTKTAGRIKDAVNVLGPRDPRADALLTPDALAFLAALHRAFGARRLDLLSRRLERKARLDAGEPLDFLYGTRHVRSSRWRIAAMPEGLAGRRADILTPPERAAIGPAAGGAPIVVDFETLSAPTWTRVLDGHAALRRTIGAAARPRGWRLPEAHVRIDGDEISGALFDFGLFVWHGARDRRAAGETPIVVIGGLGSHLEARLWSDVLVFAERRLELPRGAIKTIVSIDRIAAVFEMDEILFELREHAAGLAYDGLAVAASLLLQGSLLNREAAFDMTTLWRLLAQPDARAEWFAETCRRRGVPALVHLPAPANPDIWAGAGFNGALLLAAADARHAASSFGDPAKAPEPPAEAAIGRDRLLGLTPSEAGEPDLAATFDVGFEALAAWIGGSSEAAPVGPNINVVHAAAGILRRAWRATGVARSGVPSLDAILKPHLAEQGSIAASRPLAEAAHATLVDFIGDGLQGDDVALEAYRLVADAEP